MVIYKQEVALPFLSLGIAKGWSLSLPRGHARIWVSLPGAGSPLLTSASTSFFFMPSEESSRFCSFSSSRSARSFAWRIFCSSSVASVLAFTAYQERGNRRWIAMFIPFSKWGKSGILVECPFKKTYKHSLYYEVYLILRCTYVFFLTLLNLECILQ